MAEAGKENLKENDLVSWVQYGLPLFLRRNGSYLLLGAALCLLGYQIYNYYERKQEVDTENAWVELQTASGPGVENAPAKLDAIIRQYSSRAVQAEAYVGIADFYVLAVANGNPPEGYQGVKVTKTEALNRAEEAAKTVIEKYSDQPLASGKAHMLLAAVQLDRRDWAAAKKEYALLTDKAGPYAGTAFATAAQSRLNRMDELESTPEIAAVAATTAPTTSPSSDSLLMPPTLPMLPAAPTVPTSRP